MALEWMALALATGAEALLLLVMTLPGLDVIRKGINSVARSLLQPLLAVVPFALFLLLEIYWKFEHMPLHCRDASHCTVAEQDRHIKSMYKSQRNLILVIGSLLLYWILYRVVQIQGQLEKLNAECKKLKDAE